LVCNKLSSTQLAIIAAVIMVIGDVIGLMAALAAFNEEQQAKKKLGANLKTKLNICKTNFKFNFFHFELTFLSFLEIDSR